MATVHWGVVKQHEMLVEMCERNGFKCEMGVNGTVNVLTPRNRHPYVENVVLCRANTFKGAILFMEGYEQHAFEIKNSQETP